MTEYSHIPVVNLDSSNAPQELLDAASTYGFIFVEHTDNINVTPQQVQETFEHVCADELLVYLVRVTFGSPTLCLHPFA